jgi:hypothetical protein
VHSMLLVELRDVPLAHRLGLDSLDVSLVQGVIERCLTPWSSNCTEGSDRSIGSAADCPVHRGHKWDAWVLGGRFASYFQSVAQPSVQPLSMASPESDVSEYLSGAGSAQRNYTPRGCDAILKRDVDWEAMAARRLLSSRSGWAKALADPLVPGDPSRAKWEYGIEEEDIDEATFTKRRMDERTDALLTAAGEWLERETFVYVPKPGRSYFRKDQDWARSWDESVTAMADDGVLAIVDYHN